jgi:hypothetical protein
VHFASLNRKLIFMHNFLNRPVLLNQNPEQLASNEIDKQLLACGWIIQHKNKINLSACRKRIPD